MTFPISSTSLLTPLSWPGTASGVSSTSGTGFNTLLQQAWTDTRSLSEQSQASIESSLVGGDLSMVETFTAMREADVALRLMLQIRNKLVDAYQELQQLRF